MHLVARWIPTYAACVASLVAHEVAHAWVASTHGDPTARDQGRRTLNPLPHLDLWGSIVVPWMLIAMASPLLFAWARPAPVDHARLRRLRPDTLRVALAGPLANLLLALMFAGLARAIPQGAPWAAARATAIAGVTWNCGLLFFNLIPIPPLDGSWVLKHYLKLRHILALHHFRVPAIALTAAIVALPPSRWFFEGSFHRAVGTCFGLFGLTASGMPR